MKQSKTKTLVTAGLLTLLGTTTAGAQTAETFSPVLTAVPSLQIAPDARAAAMGDLGTSTSPDPYAQYWNPAKFAFIKSSSGLSLGYTPWLSRLVSDIALMHVGGYYKIGGEEGTQALGASLRYFTLGKLTRWDASGKSLGEAHPNEFAFDVSYARKLSESYSMAVALRYIHSDQGAGQGQSAGKAFAADIAGYLHKYVTLGGAEALWTLGFNVRNIGTKISFDGGANSMRPMRSRSTSRLTNSSSLHLPLLVMHRRSRATPVPPPSLGSSRASVMLPEASRKNCGRSASASVPSTTTMISSSFVQATATSTRQRATYRRSQLEQASAPKPSVSMPPI